MADKNDSTPVEYSTFAGDLIDDLYQANAIAEGANSIIGEGTEWESSDELNSVRRLLRLLNEKIGCVITSLDRTQFKYAVKA